MGGLIVPLNMFLYQEIQQLQSVLSLVRKTLKQLELAILGEVIMTSTLMEAFNSIYDAKVLEAFLFILNSCRNPPLFLRI